MVEIVGYRPCSRCGAQVLEHVAWQTGQVCFDCFVKYDMADLRKIEVSQRTTRYELLLPPANTPRKRRKNGTKRPKKASQQGNLANLARIRAYRRMAALFPDVYAVVYAEERWKAGLDPRPRREKDALKDAVETYTAFVTYYQDLNRSGHGEETEMVSDSDK